MGDGIRIFQRTELEVFGADYTEAQPPLEFDGGPTAANFLTESSSETGWTTRLGELYERDAQVAYAYRTRLVQDGDGDTTTLRRGDRGPRVQTLQETLVRFGHLSPAAMATGPGIFGRQTETALKEFQRANGLIANGLYDGATQAVVEAIVGGVRRGARGEVVSRLQRRLVELNYLTPQQVATGPGIFGRQTEAAVRQFQLDHGIRPTGALGPLTYNLLVNQRTNTTTNTTGGVQAPQTQPAGELSLGANERYRDALLLAQRRTGIDASALAGLINAEASRDRNGRWIADSYNARSGAGGLTQFLAGTWVGRATTAGTYLNEVAVERGFVRRDQNGRFVVVNRQALLDLRNDPTASIVSAAEYGHENLAGLERLGLLPADLTDDQRARYMYYAHHEGFAGAVRLLTDSRNVTEDAARVALVQGRGRQRALAMMREHGSYAAAFRVWTDERARYLFPTQLPGRDGRRTIDRYVAQHGDYEHGYRAWLEDYTARQVRPENYRR